FLDYPLNGREVIRKLGPVELTRSGFSYLAAQTHRRGHEETFEQWVSNRFGRRLFELFFRSYTEKVWGVPCSEIRAEWAAQRIRGLSFMAAARAAFLGNKGNKVKSLIDRFNYPRYGPGQMWEAMTRAIVAHGGDVRLNTPVTELRIEDGEVTGVLAAGEWLPARQVISSLPLREVIAMVSPPAPAEVRAAAEG